MQDALHNKCTCSKNSSSLCILGVLTLTRSAVSANFGLIDITMIGRKWFPVLACDRTGCEHM